MALKPNFSALSLSGSVDQQTGNLSVFDVMEEIRVPQLPVHRPVALVIAVLLLAACERGSRRAGGGADTVSDTSARRAPQPTSAPWQRPLVSAAELESLRVLVEAAAAGDTLRVRALLARGVSPNHPSDGRLLPVLALHRAAERGHVEIVRLLLAARADVNAVDAPGDSPLHLAARAGHAEVARLLIAGGANASQIGGEGGGVTPLHEAARSAAAGSLEVARLLLAHGASAGRRDSGGDTPLDYAIRAGRADIARLLRRALAAEPEPTIVFAPEEPRDLAWLARDVLPLAYGEEDSWDVAVATQHSGMDGGESACAYRVPWGAASVAGGLWLQRWDLRDGTVRDSVQLAAQVEGSPERCTPQAEVERRFAEETSGLEGPYMSVVYRPNDVWRLAETETFGYGGPVFRVTQRVDSTATSRQTRVCFSSGGWSQARCLTVRTSPGPNYQDRVEATVAVALGRDLWIFGLRTFGQRRGEPVWSAAAISIKPVLLGRVPVDSW